MTTALTPATGPGAPAGPPIGTSGPPLTAPAPSGLGRLAGPMITTGCPGAGRC